MASSFDLSVYNVLEAVVGGIHMIARASGVSDEVLGADATGKLISAKIALSRDDSTERLQALTKLVLTVTEYVLQTSLASDDDRGGEPRNLLAIVEQVTKHTRRHEPAEARTCESENTCAPIPLGNLGLNPELWEVITTKAGVPVAALRFNGVSYPLPQRKMEAIKTAILSIVEFE